MTGVRILTWNLDHGRFDRSTIELQQELIDKVAADIVVLSEVPEPMSRPGPTDVVSPAERAGELGPESWVRISGPQLEAAGAPLPFDRMAAAALATVQGEGHLIYGSVLPWRAATAQTNFAKQGETPTELFQRVLRLQVADIQALRRAHPDRTMIWAGDFNQPLSGPNSGFSNDQRASLRDALDRLKLVAWNEHLGHFIDGVHTIDLICGPHDRCAIRAERLAPVLNGRTLSDHPAYLVELS